MRRCRVQLLQYNSKPSTHGLIRSHRNSSLKRHHEVFRCFNFFLSHLRDKNVIVAPKIRRTKNKMKFNLLTTNQRWNFIYFWLRYLTNWNHKVFFLRSSMKNQLTLHIDYYICIKSQQIFQPITLCLSQEVVHWHRIIGEGLEMMKKKVEIFVRSKRVVEATGMEEGSIERLFKNKKKKHSTSPLYLRWRRTHKMSFNFLIAIFISKKQQKYKINCSGANRFVLLSRSTCNYAIVFAKQDEQGTWFLATNIKHIKSWMRRGNEFCFFCREFSSYSLAQLHPSTTIFKEM